ncbi:MAG: hypothetical protein KAS64_08995 [Spirochaetes bacterium]|nr:hypothetical protein [Spirochaetota bacterium]
METNKQKPDFFSSPIRLSTIVLTLFLMIFISTGISAAKKGGFLKLVGGNLRTEMVAYATDNSLKALGEEGVSFSYGTLLFLDFQSRPMSNLKLDFTIDILGAAVEKPSDFGFRATRGAKIYVLTTTLTNGLIRPQALGFKEIEDTERIELYSFNFRFKTDYFKFTGFQHTSRNQWGNEGDFFRLYEESTDLDEMDLWNEKPPIGVELDFCRGFLKGLKIVAGPEIYWGANPMVIGKYYRDFGWFDLALIHKEEITEKESVNPTAPIERKTRATSLMFKTRLTKGVALELGGIMSGSEKRGEKYKYAKIDGSPGIPYLGNSGDYVFIETAIRYGDMFGGKARVTFKAGESFLADLNYSYMGLVANEGTPYLNFDKTMMPYSKWGNKQVIEGGFSFAVSHELTLRPRGMYRFNLRRALPLIEPLMGAQMYSGVQPRNRIDDPFAVTDNREALSVEIMLDYDQTAGTYLYEWNNDDKEDAKFAFNLGVNYTKYYKDADAEIYWLTEAQKTIGFPIGLPADDVWRVISKQVFNPNRNLKIINRIEVAQMQPSRFAGDPDQAVNLPDYKKYRIVRFIKWKADIRMAKRYRFQFEVIKDGWGPYDYMREFNLTYPWQINFDYSFLINNLLNMKLASKFGLRYLYRNLDENSPPDEFLDGKVRHLHEISFYYKITL